MSRLHGAFAAAVLAFMAAAPAVAAEPALGQAAPSANPAAPGERARQLARDVLIASGADSRLAGVSDATMAESLRALGTALPNAKPDWRPAMEQAVRDEMKAFAERLFEGNIDIYSKRFTEAQLADMLAFYRTPTGQALASQSAAITRDRQALSHRYGAELLPHMVAVLCAKYACPAPAPTKPAPAAAGAHP
jgi:uncharacterized protein